MVSRQDVVSPSDRGCALKAIKAVYTEKEVIKDARRKEKASRYFVSIRQIARAFSSRYLQVAPDVCRLDKPSGFRALRMVFAAGFSQYGSLP